MIAETLFAAGELIYRSVVKHKKAQKERAEEVALFLERIADVLWSVAESLSRGAYPHGKCAELRELAERFSEVTRDVMGDSRAGAIQSMLMEAHEVEAMMAQVNTPRMDVSVDFIHKAVGKIQATATILRHQK